jgi:hypothetical protein
LVRDNSNGTGLDICYATFPIDDSVRRLFVPEDDDTNFRKSQESSADAHKISRLELTAARRADKMKPPRAPEQKGK